MPFDGEENGWICGRAAAAAAVNLQRVSSIVREIRDPCLHRSPAQRSKLLKPERWHSIFDSDGKVFCFEKALKLIILGGVDPSIRPEVWEFLLGCYALDSTTEYRIQLRKARRERYENLIRECQAMHASVGTGNLAYAVGSRVMDVRSLSKDSNIGGGETGPSSAHAVCGVVREIHSNLDVTIKETHGSHSESSSDFVDIISARRNTNGSDFEPSYDASNRFSMTTVRTVEEFPENSDFDFPPLPVTNLFQNINQNTDERHEGDDQESSLDHTLRYNDAMHSFQINNNVDLIMESNDLSSDVLCTNNFDMETCCSDAQRQKGNPKKCQGNETVTRSRISDIPSTDMSPCISNGFTVNEDRVSEWLWTLHRIAVDVVRTDSHLEFYEDSKNLARMSDILAVYAWIDPATGYCQGMSDLLSPFVVLYEDNADAFWCFEMLLRRMRENFQMSGPTGVMKQLQMLWKILELTDTEIFMHLSVIGAESLHFAFRMLLVLFRRELSFNEALCMWEMMWAADFDESLFQDLEENCLEPLVLQLPKDQDLIRKINIPENGQKIPKSIGIEHRHDDRVASQCNGLRRNLGDPFCGLTKTNFWARNDQMQICTLFTSTENSGDELPVFCVAAILIINRQKIMRKTHSIDDVIKMFNDNMLKINVKRCVHMAIKLRKKCFYKAH